MTGEFTKPTSLVAAKVGQLAKSDDYNKNLALLAKDSFIPVDVDGSPADGDLGDETIGTNGTLIEDLKVRTGKALKIYDASGNLSTTILWTDITNIYDITITSFADLSSGSYTTGNYHVATVTTGIFTANYIYLKITTGSGWAEIVPFYKQAIYLETDEGLYYYTTTGWYKYALPKTVVEQIVTDTAFSAASTVAVTWTNDANFNTYKAALNNVTVSNDGVLLSLQVSTDSGATWKAGATDYEFSETGQDSSGTVAGSGSVGTTYMVLSGAAGATGLGNTAGFNGNISFEFQRPDLAKRHEFVGMGAYYNTLKLFFIRFAGSYDGSSAAINGIRISVSAGTMSGNIKVTRS